MTLLDETMSELAAKLGAALLQRGFMIATAESCTGGLVAAAITSVAGSSDWFDRGFVTYCNQAKHDMLGVPLELIEQHGAVSEEVARAMAEGALTCSHARVALSITGIAGPGGGSDAKPVGLVWHGFAVPRHDAAPALHSISKHYAGDRAAIRSQACAFALTYALQMLNASA
jgi:nicotinamide-nucleotide amidase